MNDNLLPIELLSHGDWADVAEVHGEPSWVCRMAELGVRSGCRLQMIQPGTPCLLDVGGCRLCLRTESCMQVLVRPVAIAC
ncbi:MAG TPA: FeoA family protein [Gemmataceae bacterium]|nr:FeoA family protein [Gemmataceae bacterium]